MRTKVPSLALGTFCGLAVTLVTSLQARFAYVVNQDVRHRPAGTVSAYSIGSNGPLTPTARSLSGHKPVSVAISHWFSPAIVRILASQILT